MGMQAKDEGRFLGGIAWTRLPSAAKAASSSIEISRS
jgi:hypothetical protein